MDLVIDSNIVISGLISPNRTISKLIFKDLVKDIDKKDMLFVALSIQMDLKLWTGDKKLIQGLRAKGYKNVIETKELLDISNESS